MNCREATGFLDDYIAEALATDVRATFEGHLDRCANCRSFVMQYRHTVAAGRMAYADELSNDCPAIPDELVKAILDSLSKEPQ
jgi:hypothetical protein